MEGGGTVNRFALGGMMGFALGAGLMMMPAGRAISRDMKRKMQAAKKWVKSM